MTLLTMCWVAKLWHSAVTTNVLTNARTRRTFLPFDWRRHESPQPRPLWTQCLEAAPHRFSVLRRDGDCLFRATHHAGRFQRAEWRQPLESDAGFRWQSLWNDYLRRDPQARGHSFQSDNRRQADHAPRLLFRRTCRRVR